MKKPISGRNQLSYARLRMSLKIATTMIASRGEMNASRTARHGTPRNFYGSMRSSAICFAECSNSISKMPSIVALKLIGVVWPALTSFLMS